MNNKAPIFPLTLIIVLGIAWIGFFHNDTNADLFGHVTIGERILDTKEIPRTNTYSYTEPDHPWINQYWLSEIIFALLYRTFGNPGLILFMMAMSLGMITVAYKLIRKHYPHTHTLTTFIVLVMTIGTLRTGITIRPQLFTYLFTIIMLHQLSDMQMKRSHFILFPLLFLFWTNLHGGVVAGYGILSIWSTILLLKNWKTKLGPIFKYLAILWFFSVVASFINPYGWNLHRFLLFANRLDHWFIQEWRPITWMGYNNLFFKIVTPIYLIGIAYLIIPLRKIRWFPIIMSLISFFLAIQHIRHVAFFALMLPIALSPPLDKILNRYGLDLIALSNRAQAWWKQHSQQFQRRFKLEFIILTILSTWLVSRTPFRLLIDPNKYPVAHVRWLKANHLTGNLLNSYNWGYYLIRELYPAFKIATDGRYETAYSVDYTDQYLRFRYSNDMALSFLERYASDFILIERDLPVTRKINESPDWLALNWNSTAVLFASTKWTEEHQEHNFELPLLRKLSEITFK